MKPLNLDELSRSDYVLVSLLIVGDKVTGYSVIDKILIGSLKSREILKQNIDIIRSGSVLKTTIEVNCEENDVNCIEQVKRLGIEPNKPYDAHIVLTAISTKLLDFDKLNSLIRDYLGDAVSEVVLVYGTKEEVLYNAVEVLNNFRTISMLSERHSEDESSEDNVGSILNRVVIIDENGLVSVEDIR